MNQLVSILTAVAEVVEQYGSLILVLLLLIPILLPLLVLLPIQMVRGYKRGVYRALISMGCSVVAGLIAVPVAKILADLVAKLLLEPAINGLVSFIPPDFSVISEMIGSLTYSTGLIRGILSFVIALLLYFILILLLMVISKLVVDGLVKRPLAPYGEKKGMKVGGMFIGLADALIIALLLVLPIYTMIGNGAQFVDAASDSVLEFYEASNLSEDFKDSAPVVVSACDTVSGLCGTAQKTPPVFIAGLPLANFTDSVFAKFKCDGKYFNLFSILDDGGETVFKATTLLDDPGQYGEEQIETVDGIVDTAHNNPFFYGLMHDGISVGLQLSDVFISEEKNFKNDILTVVVDTLKESTVEDISASFDTLSDVFAITVRHEILANLKDEEKLNAALTEEAFIVETVETLRACDLLSGALDGALLVSLDYVNLSEGQFADVNFQTSIETVKNNIKIQMENGKPNIQAEITAFKCLVSGITELSKSTGKFSSFDIETIDAHALSDVLVGFGLHPYIGTNGVSSLLQAVLPTLNDKTGDIFNDEFIGKATDALIYDIDHYGSESAYKFNNLLVSAKSLTVAVSKLSVKDQNKADKESIHNLVGTLLNDTTPETADILKTAITGEVVGKLSSTNANTDAVSGMIGDLMTNMAESKYETEEETKREQEGITEMTMLALTASDRLKDPVPEGSTAIEQAVGGDIEAFLEKVTSSEVTMKTLESTIEKNEGKSDPTEAFKNLSEADKNAMLEACKNVEASSSDENVSEKLDTICSFMGLTR